MTSDLDIVRAVFDAFARRDLAHVEELVSPEVEFHAVTAQVAGREGPYVGRAGLEAYFEDVASIWEEIILTPAEFERVGELVLVTGRVWARRSGRVVDSSTGWLWKVRDGRIVWGRVFESAAEATVAARAPS